MRTCFILGLLIVLSPVAADSFEELSFWQNAVFFERGDVRYAAVSHDPDPRFGNRVYSQLIRFTADLKIDRSFGQNGRVSFERLGGWASAKVSDLKVDAQGNIYVLGKVADAPISPDWKAFWEKYPDYPVSGSAGERHEGDAEYFSLKFQRGDEDYAAKLFVSKLNAKGQFDKNFGAYAGTTFLDVFETPRDWAGKLALDAKGRVYFSATLHSSWGNLRVGRLNQDGIADSKFSAGGKFAQAQVDLRGGMERVPEVQELVVKGEFLYVYCYTFKNLRTFMGNPQQSHLVVTFPLGRTEQVPSLELMRRLNFRHRRAESGVSLASKFAVKADLTEMTVANWDFDRPGSVSISRYDLISGKRVARVTSGQHRLLFSDRVLGLGYNAEGNLQFIGVDAGQIFSTVLDSSLAPSERMFWGGSEGIDCREQILSHLSGAAS